MDHVELGAAARVLQLTVDEHPLVAGQHPGLVLHARHDDSFTNSGLSVSTLGVRSKKFPTSWATAGVSLQNLHEVSRSAVMDFSTVELSPEDQRFRAELRDFLTRHVTAEVIRRDRETGDNFDEGVHTALGAAGYLEKDFRSEAEGGWNALRRRIWELEIGRAHTPWFHWGTTAMVAQSVEKFGTPELRDEVIPGVLTGEIRLCLGYTEPEGGSDVATCRTRAVREADG